MLTSTSVSRGPSSWKLITPVCLVPSVALHLMYSSGCCEMISALNGRLKPHIFSVTLTRTFSSSTSTSDVLARCMYSGQRLYSVHAVYARLIGAETYTSCWTGIRRPLPQPLASPPPLPPPSADTAFPTRPPTPPDFESASPPFESASCAIPPGPPRCMTAGMTFLVTSSGPLVAAYLVAVVVASRAAGRSTSSAASRTALLSSSAKDWPPPPSPSVDSADSWSVEFSAASSGSRSAPPFSVSASCAMSDLRCGRLAKVASPPVAESKRAGDPAVDLSRRDARARHVRGHRRDRGGFARVQSGRRRNGRLCGEIRGAGPA